MVSICYAPILRKNGEDLPEGALNELTGGVGCTVVIRGRVVEKEYREAIDRWNQTGIKEAVSPITVLIAIHFEMVLTKTRQL